MTVIHAKGWFVDEFKKPLVKHDFEIDTEQIKPNDVVVELEASGLCHTDIHLRDNDWSIDGMLGKRPGHEGVGKVIHLGSTVTGLEVGDVIGIGWVGTSCHSCNHCIEGNGNLCAGSVPSPLYSGCFATHTVVDANWAFKYSTNWTEAGRDEYIKRSPLLCAGATIFAPLKRWIKRPAQRVGIVGCGGLGHLAIMYARRLGAECVLISRNNKKAEDAKAMGAHWTLAMDDEEAVTKAKGTFDLILSTSPATLDWPLYMSLCAIGGAFVLVGIPVDEIPVQLTDIVFRQVTLAGSIVAGEMDTREMLKFASVHDIKPMVEVVSMNNVNEAIARLEKGDVKYRFVLDIDAAMKA